MASQSTAAAITSLSRLTKVFDIGMRDVTPFYPRIATIVQSEGRDEEYGMMGTVPAVKEWLADRQFKSPRAAEFTIINKLFEVSERIEKTDIEDARLLKYGPRLQMLGQRMARHPDKLILGTLVVNAQTNLCLDGQFFFDTDHMWGDSGTQSNLITQTGTAVPALPTVTEFKAGLTAALNAIMGFLDDQGELLADDVIVGNGIDIQLMVLCPLKYRDVAITAQAAGILINNGATNIVTVTAEVVATPRITGNYFDLYRTDTPFQPYIFQARRPIQRQMKGTDDQEFKDVKFMADARYNAGYGAWWNGVRVLFT